MDRNRVDQAVSLLKGRVSIDLPVVVRRDRDFLSAVAYSLGLDGNDLLQQAQIATLMGVMTVPTAEEFPKMVFPEGDDKPGVIVADAEEEAATMALSGKVKLESTQRNLPLEATTTPAPAPAPPSGNRLE